MRPLKMIFVMLLFILAIVFIKQNLATLEHEVRLHFNIYFHTFESMPIPLWLLLLFTCFIGALTVSLFSFFEWIKHRQTIRQLQHNLEIVTSELRTAKSQTSSPDLAVAAEPEERKSQPGPA
ncbi:MAG: LapA family protein [Deltaproteobacteria bacterium]|nr:LapA family protein [Deltaproteobacteria bacterium]MBW1951817.1 LapA family protein [Deltaproteobacteria bacterium]MBW1985618.1 LapA family protein [Deltaproteobacteria bacterium]MBW2134443.1 LapA family protein [Deltaproteobacteria bacterium]